MARLPKLWLPGLLRPERKSSPMEWLSGLPAVFAADGDFASWRRSRRRRWDFEKAVFEGYERSVWAFRAVQAIANKSADRTFGFRYRGSDRVLTDHPTYRVLNGDRANPLETGPDFRYRLVAQLLLSERGAFVELTHSRAGDLIRVDLLPPHRTTAVPADDERLISRFELATRTGVRRIPVEKVRWLRIPHPYDQFASSPPIQAAGLSVQMDDLGRVINVSWMSNDSNTRMVLAVKGDLSDADATKLERRFGHGPVDAGKLSVINGDDVTVVNLAATPRDMQYQELAANAKNETLVAFGTPESQLGNASGRTWDNAEVEGFAFWNITMLPLLKRVAVAFSDPDDGLEPFFDTSDVEELQVPLRAKRSEAREEFKEGLRSISSYAQVAGIDVTDTPETRALWLPQGRTPLDQDPGAGNRVVLQQPPPAGGPPGTSPDVQPAAEEQDSAPSGRPGSTPPADPAPKPAAPQDKSAGHLLAVALTQALEPVVAKWTDRTLARLGSPKLRKHTRHWQPDPGMPADLRVGAKTLDITYAVDPQLWAQEARQAAESVAMQADTSAAAETTGAVAGLVSESAAAAADGLTKALSEVESSGGDIAVLLATVRGWPLHAWAQRISELAAAHAQPGR